MEKDKKIFLGIVIIISLIAIGLGIYLLTRDEKETVSTNTSVKDSTKFKEEYESLNNTDTGNNHKYQELTIADDNPIKYASIKDVNKLLKDGTGIIYFGYPRCPWCRNAISVLLDVAKKNNIETIYYLDSYEIRDTYELVDGKVTKTKEEQDGYQDILKYLDANLSDYVLTDENNEQISVGEKRLYVPTVVAVENGKITGFHEGTVSLDNKQTAYDALTDKQRNELSDIYQDILVKNNQTYCVDEEKC